MPGPCYYHPDTPSTGTCIQCGMPICAADTKIISGKTVCKKCVGVVRARVEREMAANPAAVGGGNAGPWPSAPAASSAQDRDPYRNYVPPPGAEHNRLALGVTLGFVIGIVCAIGLEKLLIFGGFGWSLLYAFMGYGIGYALHALTGEGGPKMAVIAVTIMLVSLVISHVVMVQDVVNQFDPHPGVPNSVLVGAAFVPVMSHLGFMHWICIALGVGSCFRGMMAQQ